MEIKLLDNNENRMIRIPEHIRWDLIRHNIIPSFGRVILAKKRCKLNCYPMTGFEHDGIFHKFYVRNWCGRIGCKGRWDETGRDGMGWACGPHTRTECIYLSIYLLIESQSRLKFNGPTHPSLHTTSRSGWGYKRQWPLHAYTHPPPPFAKKKEWLGIGYVSHTKKY
jgi:hypothetical protein